MVKDYVIVQIVRWGVHAHRQGEYGKWMLISCERPSQCLCNVVAEYEVWPSMLSKKLAMVKDYVIVHCANNQFGGGTHRQGRYRYRMLILLWETFTMPMLWQTMNSGQVCCGKSWQRSKTVIVEIVNWGKGHLHLSWHNLNKRFFSQTGGGMERG